MAMSRSAGSISLTTRPPISMVPPVMVSSPATMRSSVDLPQPDGPTSTQNCPSTDLEVDALEGIDPTGIGLPDIVQNDVGHT